MDNDVILTRVKSILDSKGLKMSDLSRLLGVTRQYLYNTFKAKSLKVQFLYDIANVLDVEVNSLLDRVDEGTLSKLEVVDASVKQFINSHGSVKVDNSDALLNQLRNKLSILSITYDLTEDSTVKDIFHTVDALDERMRNIRIANKAMSEILIDPV